MDHSQETFSRREVIAALGLGIQEREDSYNKLLNAIQEFDAHHRFDETEIFRLIAHIRGFPLLRSLRLRRKDEANVLTASDLNESRSEAYPPPLVRAASNPDPRVLKALISIDDSVSKWWEGTTPLRTPIYARLIENARILLDNGADPNDREVEQRGQSRAIFWAEIDIPFRPTPGIRQELFALEMAAATEMHDLVDLLLAAEPDTQAWMNPYGTMPEELSASYLAPSTPLDAAIQAGHIPMSRYLVRKGFNVNVFPLASIASLNPIMATITTAPDKQATYEALSPYADHSLRTKVFSVHILHLAVATHNLPWIRKVEENAPLSSAGATALGHTLLHIACLPRDESQINSLSLKIDQSIHDTRVLPSRRGRGFLSRLRLAFHPLHRIPRPPLPSDALDFPAQLSTIAHLLHPMNPPVISAQDIYGNTALHYLASYCLPNEDAIALLGAVSGKMKENVDTWTTTYNYWGFTAEELFLDGKEELKHWKAENGEEVKLRLPSAAWTAQQVKKANSESGLL
ncbi:hypothetical protein FQN57_005839 [Myotisia sp. PD_48]|nr:hypothetical protein FQN57_005839 [Myotisia sp. PD_48]